MSLIKKIYIGLFAVLYLCVAFTSTLHAIEFFGLANAPWLAVILAISFELGQAAVLFELLTSKKDRTKIMPWVLMTIFTLVQVLGNVYSSYKHIILNSPENLRFFKEPIFIWTQLPDDQATVIVTYIVGAILPICALLLTSMVTNQFENPNDSIIHLDEEHDEDVKKEESKQENKLVEQLVQNNEVFNNNEQSVNNEQEIIENEIIEKPEQQIESIEEQNEIINEENVEEHIDENVEELFNNNGNINNVNNQSKPSHFINL